MVKVLRNRTFKYGTVDTVEPQSIPRGAVASSLNWLTKGDHMELRRGHAYMGTANTGSGKVSGIRKLIDATGIERLFATYGKKLKYFDLTTLDWLENGSDILGAAVVDSNGVAKERVSLSPYTAPSGNQLFVNSPNIADIFKVLIGNPGTSLAQYDSSKNFKGYTKIDTNRTLLWGTVKDKTGVYGSYVDNQTYTTVSSESVGTGDGATKHFTHTLAAVSGKRTMFGLTVVAGSITLTDDYNGGLSASDGSTGSINYITGALVVDFATAPANLQAITTTYQWEDATNHGILDFTKSSPRTAAQGFIFRQDEGGGPIATIGQFDQIYYVFHLKKTWVLNIGADDTTATNLPYRDNVGVESLFGIIESGKGIYYLDDAGSNKKVRLNTYDMVGSTKVVPVPISNNIDLDDYDFSQAAGFEFQDYILISCATSGSTAQINGLAVAANNRTLVYNKVWKSWDVLDYAISAFDIYNGALVGGSSISNNIFELFSGYSDPDDADIANFCIFDLDDLDEEGLKKVKGLHVQGTIGPDRKIKVSMSRDRGEFVEIGGSDDASTGVHTYAVQGDGSYVDRTTRVNIGSTVLGRKEIGGGSSGAEAYNFDRIIPLQLDKGQDFQIKIEAFGVGPAWWSQADWYDIRGKGMKIPRKYRTT